MHKNFVKIIRQNFRTVDGAMLWLRPVICIKWSTS